MRISVLASLSFCPSGRGAPFEMFFKRSRSIFTSANSRLRRPSSASISVSGFWLCPTFSSLPSFAARTQFANVFIEIDSRRAASDTPTPSVMAALLPLHEIPSCTRLWGFGSSMPPFLKSTECWRPLFSADLKRLVGCFECIHCNEVVDKNPSGPRRLLSRRVPAQEQRHDDKRPTSEKGG